MFGLNSKSAPKEEPTYVVAYRGVGTPGFEETANRAQALRRGAAALRADVVTSVLNELTSLRRDAWWMPNPISRRETLERYDRIESLVRGEQQ